MAVLGRTCAEPYGPGRSCLQVRLHLRQIVLRDVEYHSNRLHLRSHDERSAAVSAAWQTARFRALLTGRSALRFELRQVRGGCLDLSLIQCRRDSSHGARRGRLPLGTCLEFVESTDDKLRGLSRNTRKASTVTFATILAVTRPTSAEPLMIPAPQRSER